MDCLCVFFVFSSERREKNNLLVMIVTSDAENEIIPIKYFLNVNRTQCLISRKLILKNKLCS